MVPQPTKLPHRHPTVSLDTCDTPYHQQLTSNQEQRSVNSRITTWESNFKATLSVKKFATVLYCLYKLMIIYNTGKWQRHESNGNINQQVIIHNTSASSPCHLLALLHLRVVVVEPAPPLHFTLSFAGRTYECSSCLPTKLTLFTTASLANDHNLEEVQVSQNHQNQNISVVSFPKIIKIKTFDKFNLHNCLPLLRHRSHSYFPPVRHDLV
jgi:hypothetical protein